MPYVACMPSLCYVDDSFRQCFEHVRFRGRNQRLRGTTALEKRGERCAGSGERFAAGRSGANHQRSGLHVWTAHSEDEPVFVQTTQGRCGPRVLSRTRGHVPEQPRVPHDKFKRGKHRAYELARGVVAHKVDTILCSVRLCYAHILLVLLTEFAVLRSTVQNWLCWFLTAAACLCLTSLSPTVARTNTVLRCQRESSRWRETRLSHMLARQALRQRIQVKTARKRTVFAIDHWFKIVVQICVSISF